MTREQHVGEDLSGQTLDAATTPDGNGHESFFQSCLLGGATFLGDWRGTDYLDNTGDADWSRARVHASYWRGNAMEGARFPADMGFLQHDPVAEIIRAGASAFRPAIRAAMMAAANFVRGNYLGGSWRTGAHLAVPTLADMGSPMSQESVAAWKQLFLPFPNLARAFDGLVQDMVERDLALAPRSPVEVVRWPDGAEVTVNALALPPLPDSSRFALARWIEGQADSQRTDEHYCFVYSIIPMRVRVLPRPDGWLTLPLGGY